MSATLTPPQLQKETEAAAPAPFVPLSWSRLFWWILCAAAFGYVEAAVVAYLRRVFGMAPGYDYPALFAERRLPFDSPHILNLLRQDHSVQAGLKARRLKAGWDEAYLVSLLNG